MDYKKIAMEHDKKIALVTHDNKKADLVQWAKYNRDLLAHHQVFATGTTGVILEQELGFKISKLESGPLGGDKQVGAKIIDDKIDFRSSSGIHSNRSPTIPTSRRSHGNGVEHPDCLEPASAISSFSLSWMGSIIVWSPTTSNTALARSTRRNRRSSRKRTRRERRSQRSTDSGLCDEYHIIKKGGYHVSSSFIR